MDARQRLDRGARRDVAREQLEHLAFERPVDGAQPVGPLGMAFAHVVRESTPDGVMSSVVNGRVSPG